MAAADDDFDVEMGVPTQSAAPVPNVVPTVVQKGIGVRGGLADEVSLAIAILEVHCAGSRLQLWPDIARLLF